MSNLTTIVKFLEGKGYSKNAIAGILGNLQVESGLSTTAHNAREGAIGLAQWEGDRRTALQSFARSRGTSETDLDTQLEFMHHEIQQRGLSGELNGAGSAGSAASLFDQHFEVSAGTTRSQRVSGANEYASSGGIHAGSSGSAMPLHAVPTLTNTQKRDALKAGAHDLYSLAASVPELSQLINKAITSGQSAADFANAVEGSSWYKTHSDTVRNQIVLKQSDPATYHQNQLQAENHVRAIGQQLGAWTGKLTAGIAQQYLAQGWNDDQLKAYFESAHGIIWTKGGATGSALGQLQSLASDYGVPMGSSTMMHWAKEIAVGRWTADQFKLQMQTSAGHIYPGLAKQLASGQTTRQLADPYVQTYAQTLEVAPESVNWSTDPLIKRALQTPATPVAGSKPAKPGKTAAPEPPGTTPLWQFEQQLRSDPRWDRTNNAKSATAGMLSQLGQAWGYSS